MPDRYNIELLRIEHKDYVVKTGALNYMPSQGLPKND
jgi:hypothetical protein